MDLASGTCKVANGIVGTVDGVGRVQVAPSICHTPELVEGRTRWIYLRRRDLGDVRFHLHKGPTKFESRSGGGIVGSEGGVVRHQLKSSKADDHSDDGSREALFTTPQEIPKQLELEHFNVNHSTHPKCRLHTLRRPGTPVDSLGW